MILTLIVSIVAIAPILLAILLGTLLGISPLIVTAILIHYRDKKILEKYKK